MKIAKSEWGWTAYADTGRPVAHSHDRALLESYVSMHDRADRVDVRPPEPDVDPRPMPTPQSSGTSPLTSVTYTTRARSTGAVCQAGRTTTGWGAYCTAHSSQTSSPSRGAAEIAVSRPQEWCAPCSLIAAGLEDKVPKS